jgi:hypothetical protein
MFMTAQTFNLALNPGLAYAQGITLGHRGPGPCSLAMRLAKPGHARGCAAGNRPYWAPERLSHEPGGRKELSHGAALKLMMVEDSPSLTAIYKAYLDEEPYKLVCVDTWGAPTPPWMALHRISSSSTSSCPTATAWTSSSPCHGDCPTRRGSWS